MGQIDRANLEATPQANNPFEGFAHKAATVKVDGWKQGKNDCLEHILLNQGYELGDIYKKDANGKTLVERVAAANGFKNPNLVPAGKEIVVPTREGAEALSTRDLDRGQTAAFSVGGRGSRIDLRAERADEGGNKVTAETDARESDARLATGTEVSERGRINAVGRAKGDQARAQISAKSGDGTAVTLTSLETTPERTRVAIRDADRNSGNLHVQVVDGAVTTVNKAQTGEDDVVTRTDISESYSDGPVENFSRGVSQFFGFKGPSREPVAVKAAAGLNLAKNDEGQVTVTVSGADGKQTTHTTAGDTDDTWFERTGEGIDNFGRWSRKLFLG